MARLTLAVLALVVFACGAGEPAARAAVADRDHDKISDDLEPRLAGDRRVPILVSLRERATAGRLAGIQRSVGSLDQPGALHIVHAFWAKATPAQIRALARRPDVAAVEPDAKVVPFDVSAQSSFGIAQAQTQIPGLDGHGEVAAVIDSGIDPTMPDLAGKIVGWKDITSDRDTPYDDLGHGSMVSDIIAGSGATGPEGRGVAPGADLVGVKVIDANDQSSLSLIAQGIQWAVDNRDRYGIDVINLSIGDPTGCGDGQDPASQAVNAAVAAGIVVVAAAGNAGPAACTVKDPGAAADAVTVGAMADTGAGGFSNAWFSSRGPTADGRLKPDVSAPGANVQIAQPGGGLITGSGTSFATPFVTGTALLMRQAGPALTPAQVKGILERTAVDWGAPGPDDDYGAGRLDAYAALQAAGATLAVPPAQPAHTTWTGTLSQGETFERGVDVGGSGFPLAVTMTGPPIAAANFDLTLLDPGGNPVGTALPQYFASRQEDLSVPAPAPGRYTVRITATSGSGEFVADVSGVLAPADATAPVLSLDAVPAVTRDPGPALGGAAGDALGDFPGVVVTIRHGEDVVRRIAAQPLLGRWSAAISPPLPDGDYTAEAEQGDAAGNVTRTPARGFAIDATPPGAPVVASPAEASRQRATTVALSGTAEPSATVEVREAGALQGGPTADAQGNWALPLDSVSEGTHGYDVVARDAAGNVSTSVRRTVTVDSTPPAAQLDGGPASLVAGRAVSFAFSSTEPGSTFGCRLQGPGRADRVEACAPPAAFSDLADGDYTFTVWATDRAGNESAPVTRTFTVDTAAPVVTITSGPEAKTQSGAATFRLTTSERADGQCRIDAGAWEQCSDSASYSALPVGPHIFEARATDAAGNTGAVARWAWTVDAAGATPIPTPPAVLTPAPLGSPPPCTLTLGLHPQPVSSVGRRGLLVSIRASRACRVRVTVKLGRTLLGRRTVSAVDRSRRFLVRLPRRAQRDLARAQRAKLTVTAASAGARSVTRRVTLRR